MSWIITLKDGKEIEVHWFSVDSNSTLLYCTGNVFTVNDVHSITPKSPNP